ncbi:MAG: hypothetical protein O3B95_07670 [Chloroflexi bacterium]|nr:hypothetical protein [Chloroflexota bacterium]
MAGNSDLGRKILVAGQGGKTSLARALAADLNLPNIELDALSYLRDWVARPKDDFREIVRRVLVDNPEGWVIDGNYGTDLQGMIVKEAETVIYVNMPWSLMMWRIFLRSIARARDKRLICGENVETWRRAFFSRHSLLWFLVKNRKGIRERRPVRLREWAKDAHLIELEGRKALNRFYTERGLVRVA